MKNGSRNLKFSGLGCCLKKQVRNQECHGKNLCYSVGQTNPIFQGLRTMQVISVYQII